MILSLAVFTCLNNKCEVTNNRQTWKNEVMVTDHSLHLLLTQRFVHQRASSDYIYIITAYCKRW